MEVLQVVVRSDTVYPFLIIPVRECIRQLTMGSVMVGLLARRRS